MYTTAVNTARSSSGAVPPPCGRELNDGGRGATSSHRPQQAAQVVPHPPPRLDAREPAAHPQEELLKFRCPPTRSKILDHARTLPAQDGRPAQTHPSDEGSPNPHPTEHQAPTLRILPLTSRNSETLLEYYVGVQAARVKFVADWRIRSRCRVSHRTANGSYVWAQGDGHRDHPQHAGADLGTARANLPTRGRAGRRSGAVDKGMGSCHVTAR